MRLGLPVRQGLPGPLDLLGHLDRLVCLDLQVHLDLTLKQVLVPLLGRPAGLRPQVESDQHLPVGLHSQHRVQVRRCRSQAACPGPPLLSSCCSNLLGD